MTGKLLPQPVLDRPARIENALRDIYWLSRETPVAVRGAVIEEIHRLAQLVAPRE